MLAHSNRGGFQWPARGRVVWLVVAIGMMFVSAYCAMRWLGTVGAISGWTGLPQYANQIPRLSAEARLYMGLALALPFLAALVLGFGVNRATGSGETAMLNYPSEPRPWTSSFERYIGRLVVSVLGTAGFILCLVFIGYLLYKAG